MCRRILLSVFLLCAIPVCAFAQPVRPGFVLVDDMILPAWAVSGDAVYTGTPWTDGNVYYEFDANVSVLNQTRTLEAMGEIEGVVDVDFIERTTQSDYLHIQDSNRNNSYVGMIGGSQTVNLASWSSKFVICHELMHALSFLHEQARPDRDTYVTINFANVNQTACSGGSCNVNFTLSAGATSVGTYDFASIMHYGAYAFSVNGLPTIETNPGYTQYQSQMGNRSYMTHLDALGLAARYGAPPPPAILGFSAVAPSSGGLILTIQGGPFIKGVPTPATSVQGSVVTWNGMNLVTTYVRPTVLTAFVPAGVIPVPECAEVMVVNASPGGGCSNPILVPVGGASCPGQPVNWQLNSVNATCHIDGMETASVFGPPAIVTKNYGDPFVLSYIPSPAVASLWDAVVSLQGVVPASCGGLLPPQGGVVNIDLFDPALFFLMGGAAPSLSPSGSGPAVYSATAPAADLTISTQMFVITPSVPSAIEFSQASQLTVCDNCSGLIITAVGPNSYNSNTRSGFFTVTNTDPQRSVVALDVSWVGSSNPSQGTMRFDTDQDNMVDLFIGGNSAVPGCSGTYRNGCDVTLGLTYGPGQAVPVCDPGAFSGFVGGDPGSTAPGNADFRTLSFAFTSFGPGGVFEFDCDTDGGAGISGDAMAGLVCTVTWSDGSTSTGELVVDASASQTSIVALP